MFADHDLRGVQKFHARPVPRVGGIGVMLGLVAGAIVAEMNHAPFAPSIWLLMACALPAFGAGIAEDLTKKVTPRWRLLATAVSAGLAAWLLNGLILRTHIPGLDLLLPWTPFAVALTLFTVAGVANAINIIDGFNGLASMCVFMMILAMAYVAFQVGDTFVFTACLITAGAVLGFFVWNFPAGLIFLGDGGAYLLGFLLAELGILLVHRNANVSPIFPLLLCAYPIFETIFTMYRRKFVRGVATAAPDGIHLHTLIHRRLIRWTLQNNLERRRLTRRNSMTSPYLWLLCLTSVIPSVLWWNSTAILSWFLLAFVIAYVWLYARIVRFKTPRWMVFRRHR
ncbi:glycosyl transferase [Piscinibacter gummiphilus]|nr:glycosyltransferase [Piscinibacter gummiphilus]GLS97688.1 glycosyl transferase [Piscinibacter gummiphilus]